MSSVSWHVSLGVDDRHLVGLVQPDQRSCGAAVLVAAQLLMAPASVGSAVSKEWFRNEVLALHRRVTSARDVGGRWQLPWPRAIGTPPWAVAHHLSAVTGERHAAQLVVDRRQGFRRLHDVVAAGSPVPLYVGSHWLPRHVVLVTAPDEQGRFRFYDPARGVVVTLARDAFVDGRLGLSRWNRPWFTILPRVRRSRA